jgi:hypothetical protein
MALLQKTTYLFAVISALAGLGQFTHSLFPVRTQEATIESKPYCDQGRGVNDPNYSSNVSYFLKIDGSHFSVPERVYRSYDDQEIITLKKSSLNGHILEIAADDKRHSLTYHRSFLPFWVSIWLYFIPLVVFVSETTRESAWALRLFLFLSVISISTFVLSIVMGDSVMVNEAMLSYPPIENY